MYNQEPVNHIRTWVEPNSFTYHVRIDRDIEETSRFQEEIVQIRQAKEGDVVHLYVASDGGSASTMSGILAAIEQSPATIRCELESKANSAGSFIFLSGDQFIVNSNAEMMIHEMQIWLGGSTSNSKRQMDHISKQNEKLVRRYYDGFLTPEEIEDVLSGGEMYLDSDDIADRLEKRTELFAEKNQAIDEQYMAEDKDYLQKLDKDTLISMLMGEEVELPDPDGMEEDSGDVVEESQYKVFGKFSLDTWCGDIVLLDEEVECNTIVFDRATAVICDLKLAKEFADEVGIGYHKTADKRFMAEKLTDWVDDVMKLEEG